jgi:hypothetical protein
MLFGGAGAVAGLIGAATFLPYRDLDSLTVSLAQTLTGISAVGAIVSAFGVYAGWRLLAGRSWGWSSTFLAAVASVGSVAALAAVWPASAPFLGVAAFFYAIELILLGVGVGSIRARSPRPAGA